MEKNDDTAPSYYVSTVLSLAFLLGLSVLLAAGNPRIVILQLESQFGTVGLLNSIGITVFRVIVGTVCAFIVGVSLAIVVRLGARPALGPSLAIAFALAVTPSPIWLTVLLVSLGLSEAIPFILVFVTSVFFVFAIAVFQIRRLPERLFFLSRLFGHSTLDRLRYLFMPALRGPLCTTARIACLVSWTSVVFAESAGSASGIGAMLLLGRQLFDWPMILVSWSTILLGAAMTDLLVRLLCEAGKEA